MKKYIKLLLCVIIILTITGCNPKKEKIKEDDTLANYIKNHNTTGIAVRNIKCDILKNNNIMLIDHLYFILENGEIYSLARDNEVFSNNQQCIKLDENISIQKIKYGYLIGNDNKIYSINYDIHDQIYIKEEDQYVFDIGSDLEKYLKTDDVIKLFEIPINNEKYQNKNNEKYYSRYLILKNDGNIYDVIASKIYSQNKYKIEEEKVLYSKEEYGFIKDFNGEFSPYLNINKINNIISEDNYYSLKEIKTKECQKYADIKCELKLQENSIYNKYKNEIKYIGSTHTLLKDNTIFTTSLLDELENNK